MKRRIINNNGRPKAFIGAAIGAVGNIVGSAISAHNQKKMMRQQQKEQVKQEGFQKAAAMSSQYANQDYVEQYDDKIALKCGGKAKYADRIGFAKKYKCGGRKKAGIGTEIKDDIADLKNSFNKDNIGNTISTILNASSNFINPNSFNPANEVSAAPTTIASIQKNKAVAQEADERKQQQTSSAKYGTRKKAAFGLGEMIGGIGNAAGAAMQGATPGIKKSIGYSYDAPKTGIEKNSYQVDENGNPINVVNNTYGDRLQQARLGKRCKRKCGGAKYC